VLEKSVFLYLWALTNCTEFPQPWVFWIGLVRLFKVHSNQGVNLYRISIQDVWLVSPLAYRIKGSSSQDGMTAGHIKTLYASVAGDDSVQLYLARMPAMIAILG